MIADFPDPEWPVSGNLTKTNTNDYFVVHRKNLLNQINFLLVSKRNSSTFIHLGLILDTCTALGFKQSCGTWTTDYIPTIVYVCFRNNKAAIWYCYIVAKCIYCFKKALITMTDEYRSTFVATMKWTTHNIRMCGVHIKH